MSDCWDFVKVDVSKGEDDKAMVAATIEELQKEFGLDGRRIYLGGFSMGGCGTWELLTRYPDLFAAAFPIAGPPYSGAPGERPGLAAVVKHVPVWAFPGGLRIRRPRRSG